MKKVFILIILLLLLLGACVGKYVLGRDKTITLDLDYTEGTQSLTNPERGWYLINAYLVSDDVEQTDSFNEELWKQKEEGDTLTLILFNLSNYRSEDISENGLNFIARILADVKKAGMKAIVRFVYDWDGNGEQLEPDNIETVLRHMEQLGPVLNENKSGIYLLQGILVGSYGEMNGSKYLSRENVATLLNKFLKVTDDSILLSVRTPAYWRAYAQSNRPVDKYTSLPYARIGLYNDGLCSSDTDLGTYSDDEATDNNITGSWGRQQEIDFQSELCRIVPNGGETAVLSEFNDLDRIVREFPAIHISYLNRGYQDLVLNKWKDSILTTRDASSTYQGIDGYKYIGDHLGYRFVLRKVTVSSNAYTTSKNTIHIEIENTGFAGLYKQKTVELILKGVGNGYSVTIPIEEDVRDWKSGEISAFDIAIPPNILLEDSYEMYLKITDEQGTGIRMANNEIFQERLQANAVGSIKIEKLTLRSLWKRE